MRKCLNAESLHRSRRMAAMSEEIQLCPQWQSHWGQSVMKTMQFQSVKQDAHQINILSSGARYIPSPSEIP